MPPPDIWSEVEDRLPPSDQFCAVMIGSWGRLVLAVDQKSRVAMGSRLNKIVVVDVPVIGFD
jgi:hypothetical protein